jgi:Putative MetA-pathway of phenol degradation
MATSARSAVAALLLVFLLPPWSIAQTSTPAVEEQPRRIQDNSFLLEEAYNQEPGVIQHISTFTRSRTGDWTYTFTQEWPVPGQTHQLSYTIPVQRVDPNAGLGDVALNYRYQLIGSGETTLAMAPRLSVLLPTGNEKRGLGAGGTGIQVNIPVSLVLSDQFVTHSNAGATHVPSARNADGDRASTTAVNLGQSIIWQPTERFNVLLEALYVNAEVVTGDRRTRREDTFFVNPGIRWAHDFENGLQIVPGIAFPVGLGPSHGEWALFLYLSFEHPLWKAER